MPFMGKKQSTLTVKADSPAGMAQALVTELESQISEMNARRADLRTKQTELLSTAPKEIASLNSRMTQLGAMRDALAQSIEAGKKEVTIAFAGGKEKEKSVVNLRLRLRDEASDVAEIHEAIDHLRHQRERLRFRLETMANDVHQADRHLVHLQIRADGARAALEKAAREESKRQEMFSGPPAVIRAVPDTEPEFDRRLRELQNESPS